MRALRTWICHRALRLPSAPAVLALLVWIGVCAASPGRAEDPGAEPGLDVDQILRLQNARLDSLLDPLSTRIDTTGIRSLADSLDREGYGRAKRLHPQSFGPARLRAGLRPLALTSYQRVDGWRVGSGVEFGYGRNARLSLGGAWGAESHRWGGRGELQLGRRTRGPGFDLRYGDLVEPYGPDAALPAPLLVTWLAGQDRQDYLRRREISGRLHLFRQRTHEVALTGFRRRDRSESARTDFSLLRGHGRPIERPNVPVDDVTWSGIEARGRVSLRQGLYELGGRAGHAIGDTEFPWVAGRVTLRPVFPDGGVLSLSLEGEHVGSRAVWQAEPFLGGDANLRGYPRQSFRGRSRISGRAEYATGIDILRHTDIPLLRSAKIQFIPFFDVGTTYGTFRTQAPVSGEKTRPGPFLEGSWKSAVGVGLQRALWFPGLEAVRLDIIRRNDGADDPWSFWFRIVELTD